MHLNRYSLKNFNFEIASTEEGAIEFKAQDGEEFLINAQWCTYARLKDDYVFVFNSRRDNTVKMNNLDILGAWIDQTTENTHLRRD